MNKADIICTLKTNNYSFEDKENQVIIRLARRYFLKLYIANDNIVKDEDVVKRFGWLTNGKSLKVATMRDMVGYSIYLLLFVLLCILDPYFFSNGGKYFFIGVAPMVLQLLIEFWYYNKRLSKIKKLLNLND